MENALQLPQSLDFHKSFNFVQKKLFPQTLIFLPKRRVGNRSPGFTKENDENLLSVCPRKQNHDQLEMKS